MSATNRAAMPAFGQLFSLGFNRVLTGFQCFDRAEDGTLSVISLLAMLGFALLIGALFNCVIVVQEKMEIQNAADAAAQGAGTEFARGLNAVTAANHLIGELQALVVLHHALAGDDFNELSELDRPHDVTSEILQSAYQAAERESPGTIRPDPRDYQSVAEFVPQAAAIGDACAHLRQVMTHAYRLHAAGAFLETKVGLIPELSPAAVILGRFLVISAAGIETKVSQEAETLRVLQTELHDNVMPARIAAENLIRVLHDIAISHANQAGLRAERTAQNIGQAHKASGSLFPGALIHPSSPQLRLPLQPEPALFPDELLPKSQLVRASVPWIHYWRLPLLEFGDEALRLSRFKSYYVARTQEYTLKLAQRAKQRGIQLLILEDFDPFTMTKGSEVWATADGSRICDQRFAVLAFSHRPPPLRMGARYFANPNSHGIAAFAQTLAYNANPQQPKAAEPGWQARVGWDTLNWHGADVPEWELGSDPTPEQNTPTHFFRDRCTAPSIRLNWQSLLTPTTRLPEAVDWQPGELGEILRRTAVDIAAARTH